MAKPHKGGKKPTKRPHGVSKERRKQKYDKSTRRKKWRNNAPKSMQKAIAATDRAEQPPQVTLLGETSEPLHRCPLRNAAYYTAWFSVIALLQVTSAPVHETPNWLTAAMRPWLSFLSMLCSLKHPAAGDDDDFGQMPLDASSSGEDESQIGLQEGNKLAPDTSGHTEHKGKKERKAERAATATGGAAAKKLVPP